MKAIGITSFSSERLQDLILHDEINPMVNQLQTNPWHRQKQAQEFLSEGFSKPVIANIYWTGENAQWPRELGDCRAMRTILLKEDASRYWHGDARAQPGGSNQAKSVPLPPNAASNKGCPAFERGIHFPGTDAA